MKGRTLILTGCSFACFLHRQVIKDITPGLTKLHESSVSLSPFPLPFMLPHAKRDMLCVSLVRATWCISHILL